GPTRLRRRPGPRRTQDPTLPLPAHRRPTDPQRTKTPPENPPNLALGSRHRPRLGPHQRPPTSTLTTPHPFPPHSQTLGARATPAHPPPQPAPRHAHTTDPRPPKRPQHDRPYISHNPDE